MKSTDLMTRDEALKNLTATASHERLKAARHLTRLASFRDAAALRQALHKEPVSYVKRALTQALEGLDNKPFHDTIEALDDEPVELDIERQAYTRAVQWVTSSLIHEILPRLGAIKLEARKVIDGYDRSVLKLRIDALTYVLDGFEEIQRASVLKDVKEFDFYGLMALLASEATDGTKIDIFLQGPKDMIVAGDRGLFVLALGNALKNAVEATKTTPDTPPIIVSWGSTDVDYWVTILDHGPGVAGPTEAAFVVGRTTKAGHRGFGLAIARQALITLDGTIDLQSAASGGARVDIRWFK